MALLKKTCKEKDGTLEKMKAELREIKHSMTDSALDGVSSFPSFRAGSTDKSVRFSEATDMNKNHVSNNLCVSKVLNCSLLRFSEGCGLRSSVTTRRNGVLGESMQRLIASINAPLSNKLAHFLGYVRR